MDWKAMAQALRVETERLQKCLDRAPGAGSASAIAGAIIVLNSLQVAIEVGSAKR